MKNKAKKTAKFDQEHWNKYKTLLQFSDALIFKEK